PISDDLPKRFNELAEQGLKVLTRRDDQGTERVDPQSFQGWASSAMHIVAAAFGEDSPHYRNLDQAYSQFKGYPGSLAGMNGAFLAAKSDYEGGYVFSFEKAIAGEIFGDFVVAAKAALTEGQKDVAAVLACAALEDALKRFGRLKGLQVDGKDMQQVVNAL